MIRARGAVGSPPGVAKNTLTFQLGSIGLDVSAIAALILEPFASIAVGQGSESL